MTTAYKLAQQTIRTVDQAEVCRELMREKLKRVDQTQPIFSYLSNKGKRLHPYYDLIKTADQTYASIVRLVKGYGQWRVKGKTVEGEIDAIKANYTTSIAGADEATVDLIKSWKFKFKAKSSKAAADEMIKAMTLATDFAIRVEPNRLWMAFVKNMSVLRVHNLAEIPELDITKDSVKLVTELQKLNVLLRDVQRNNASMMDWYGKEQTMNILKQGGNDSVLDNLMK